MYNYDYYAILKIKKNATDKEIKSSFRKLAKKKHPDHGGSQEEFIKLNEAYSVLSDSIKRKEYDDYLLAEQNYKFESLLNNLKEYQSKKEYGSQADILDIDTFEQKTVLLDINLFNYPPNIYTREGKYFAVVKGKSYIVCTPEEWEKIISYEIDALHFYKKKINKFKNRSLLNDLLSLFLGLLLRAAPLIILAILVAIASLFNWGGIGHNQNSTQVSQTKEIDLSQYKEFPIPEHGSLSNNINKSNGSILEITLPKDEDKYYFIKLVDPSSDNEVQTAFLYPGTKTEICVPYGSYKLKYACGTTWYGYDDLFGPYGGYAKSDDLLTFTVEYYHSVTLYPVLNGNMTTKNINYSDF